MDTQGLLPKCCSAKIFALSDPCNYGSAETRKVANADSINLGALQTSSVTHTKICEKNCQKKFTCIVTVFSGVSSSVDAFASFSI